MRKLSIFVGCLLSLLLIILSACSSLETLSEEVLYDSQITVREDEYFFFEIILYETVDVNIQFEVVSGPEVEGFMVNEAEFKRFDDMMQSGQIYESIKHIPEFESFDTKLSEQKGTLSAGTYYYVIDNTDFFYTVPAFNLMDDVANIEVFISVK